MRYGGHFAVCLATLFVGLFGFCGEVEGEISTSVKDLKFEAGPMVIGDREVDPTEILVSVAPAEGPHVQLGKAAEWVINNSIKANGWSFSGWSKTGLDEDFRPWRLHIGIISGELDVGLADRLADRSNHMSGYELWQEWNQRRQNGIGFGVVFTKHF